MCGLVLLILGIVYATRIPKYLRSTPAEYPGCDPQVHAQWRAKELWSIYAFLIATWGQVVVFFFLGLGLGLMFAHDQAKLDSLVMILTGLEVAVFLGGLIWAAVLGSQARKLKIVLGQAATLPPSYYPRPGQALLQNPQPPMAPPPPVAPPVDVPEQQTDL